MIVQLAEPKSTQLKIGNLSVPETLDQLIAGSVGLDRTSASPVPIDDTVPALPDRQTAYPLLAEQCRSRVTGLTRREREVLAWLVGGRSNKQIAHVLGVSIRTIEMHRARMMRRLQVRTLPQALYIAFVAGLTPSDTISHWTV